MRFLVCFIIGCTFFVSLHAQIHSMKIEQLERLLSLQDDTVRIVNFWATWCKPCIEELPHFEEATKYFSNKNVRIVLVSLDFHAELDKVLIPFLQRKNLQSSVMVLEERDPNLWIDRIEPTWTGSLPATIFMNGAKKKRQFYEKQLTKEELFTTIKFMME